MATIDVAATRARVARAISDALGCQCHPTAPERPSPPFVYLTEPPDGFVTAAEGYPYGTWAVTFAFDAVQRPTGSNASIIAAADTTAASLLALDGPDYTVTLDGYVTVTHAGQTYLSVPGTITAYLTT